MTLWRFAYKQQLVFRKAKGLHTFSLEWDKKFMKVTIQGIFKP